MEEKYVVPDKPTYSEDIRKLQDDDPASASQIFNPLFSRLIENIASVKQKADGAATLDAGGKVPAEQLPSLCPFVAGTSEPEDTLKLWIDTTPETGGLKYWSGTAWVHVPVSYT